MTTDPALYLTEDIVLTAETRAVFDDFYQRWMADAGPPVDNHDELKILKELLYSVRTSGLTPTPDGKGIDYVRRDTLDWTNPSTIAATQAASAGASGKNRATSTAGGKRGANEMVPSILMLLGAVAVGAWFFLGRGGKPVKGEAPETPLAAEIGARTEPTPLPTLEASLLADIVDAGTKTSLVVPRTLEISGVSFIVQPVKVESGDWPLPEDERAVSWVYGTVVNYVIGLEATPENKQTLSAVKPGDELILRMSTGLAYRFAYADTVRVSPQSSEIFRQTEPLLTLVLMADPDEQTRIVLRAVYLPESELGLMVDQSASPPVTLGERVVLNDELLVTVTAAYPAPGGQSPAGYIELAIDYRLENKAGRDFGSDGFRHQLEAGGLSYTALANQSSAGHYPPLPPSIRPDQVVTATARYLVPETVLRSGSIWGFAPLVFGRDVARVQIPPFAGELETAVRVLSAEAQPDGGILLLVELKAMGEPVTIGPSDIQVQGVQIAPAGNIFPWTVAAGARGSFPLYLESGRSPMQLSIQGQTFVLEVRP